jgi:hypothetical protein
MRFHLSRVQLWETRGNESRRRLAKLDWKPASAEGRRRGMENLAEKSYEQNSAKIRGLRKKWQPKSRTLPLVSRSSQYAEIRAGQFF